MRIARVGILFALVAIASVTRAEDVVRLAVAANFKSALEELTVLYSQTRPTKFVISSGASGVLYAQIRSEAPFDLFFSADIARPEQLERDGATLPDTRRTYAIGKLVLWTPKRPITGDLRQTLNAAPIRTVAIANPATAPYGAATEKVLQRLNLPKKLKIVRGENVGQAFQFLVTGNADAGFIARAQVRDYERTSGRSLAAQVLAVELESAAALEQQMVLLRPATNNAAARSFWEFIQTPEAQRFIAAAGYQSPTWTDPNCHGCKREDAPKLQ